MNRTIDVGSIQNVGCRSAPDGERRLDRYLEFDQLHGPYLDWQIEHVQPFLGDRILEIGCGVGGIIARLPPCSLICGLDVEADVLEAARTRFADRTECLFDLLDVSTCSGQRLDCLRDFRFDTVICINVLEHIEDDLGTLRRLENLLQPGGKLLLLVPAHPQLFGAYDRLDGHFRRYSRPGLKQLLQQTSFRVRRMYYFNAIGAVGWWYHYRLRNRTMHGGRQFRTMNRLIPLVRRIERLAPPPFGLSLVAILER